MADRVAVVTGAGRGVGAAIARRLSREDWAVVVVDSGVEPDGSGYDPDPAEEVSGQIWQAGGSARPVCADVTTRAGLEFAMETATRLGSPMALVHAAGIVAEQAVPATTDETWRSVLAVHLDAAFTASRAFWPLFESVGGGRIVLVGGADGLLGAPGHASYAAAKSGLIGLMRVLAAEGAAAGISANLVLPFAETRLSPSRSSGLAGYPNGAPGARAEDVAPLVAWLCSGQGAAITGQVLGVRGAELTVWSQPRPVARIVATEGWTLQAFQPLTHPAMVPLLSPLGPEDGLLGGEPIPVRTEVPITGRVLDVTDRRSADLFPEGEAGPAEGAPSTGQAGDDRAGRVIYLDDGPADPDGSDAEHGDGPELPDGYVMTDVVDGPGDAGGPGAYPAYPDDRGDVVDLTGPEDTGSAASGGFDRRDGVDAEGDGPAAAAAPDPATSGWPRPQGWPEPPGQQHAEAHAPDPWPMGHAAPDPYPFEPPLAPSGQAPSGQAPSGQAPSQPEPARREPYSAEPYSAGAPRGVLPAAAAPARARA